jgi:isoleucyl-tRNA synthetase
VALDLTIDDDLIRAGQAREIVHAIQQLRRDRGLEITDRIDLALGGDPMLLDAAREHEPYIAGETLARSVSYVEREQWDAEVAIDGATLCISLERAQPDHR